MASVTFVSAKLLFGGYDVSGDFNQVELSNEAEALDATVFGNTSRVKKGGLKIASVRGAGYWQAGANAVDPVFHESLSLADAVVMLFPDGITEGSTATGAGYMFKSTLSKYSVAGSVGDHLPFTVEAEGRGVGS